MEKGKRRRKSKWGVVLVEWCVGLLFVEKLSINKCALFFVDGQKMVNAGAEPA